MLRLASLLYLLHLVMLLYAASPDIGSPLNNKQLRQHSKTAAKWEEEKIKTAESHRGVPVSSPNTKTLSKEMMLTVKQIQHKLQHTQMFLGYFCEQQHYYCLSVTTKDTKLTYCGSKTEIDSLLLLHHFYINSKNYNKEVGSLIAEKLLPKYLSKSLIILPYEALYMLSFDVLQDPATKDYLIYRHDIEYALSASDYFYSKPTDKKTGLIGFFPASDDAIHPKLNTQAEEQELQLMPHYFGFKGAAATKAIFIQESRKAGILHIATHAVKDKSDTSQIAIVFSDKDKDNRLFAKEIQYLNLNIQLVTLAACNSNNSSAENSGNLTRAFHAAGAHHILSSIGDAPDLASTKLMSAFYRNLKNGATEAEALRMAKINYLKNTDAMGAQPYFWANYTLYGDHTNVLITSDNNILFWIILLMGTVLCFSAVKIYKKRCIKSVVICH